jgi:hypothetical protein
MRRGAGACMHPSRLWSREGKLGVEEVGGSDKKTRSARREEDRAGRSLQGAVFGV